MKPKLLSVLVCFLVLAAMPSLSLGDLMQGGAYILKTDVMDSFGGKVSAAGLTNLRFSAGQPLVIGISNTASPVTSLRAGFIYTGVSTEPPENDTTAPGAVTDLVAATGTSDGDIVLTWTAPCDDGYVGTDKTSVYIIKCSSAGYEGNIEDETAFSTSSALVAFSTTTLPAPTTGNTIQSFTVGNLVLGVTYYFAIKAQDNMSQTGSWSRATGVNQNNYAWACDANPPTPTNVIALSGDRQIALQWTAVTVSDFANYKIYRALDDQGAGLQEIGTTSNTFYTDSTVSNGTSYYYQVASVDQGPNVKESAKSGYAIGYPYRSKPTAPTNFRGIAFSTAAISWSWTDTASTEYGFELQTSTGGIMVSSNTVIANSAYWIQTGFTQNTSSYVRYVRAVNEMGQSSWVQSTVFPAYSLANPPLNLIVTGVTPSQVALSWDTNNNPFGTRYGIFYSLDSGFSSLSTYTTSYTNSSITVNQLSVSTSYWFRVVAYNGNGVITTYSSTDTITMSAIAPAAVTNLSIDYVGGTSVRLTWTAPGDDGTTGNITGGMYDIRYMVGPDILSNWDTATTVSWSTNTIPGYWHDRLITGLIPDTTYSFAIMTEDVTTAMGAWSGISNSAITKTLDTTPPGGVTIISITGLNSSPRITLNWTNPTDADYIGTKVYFSAVSTPTSTTGTEIANRTAVIGSPDSLSYTNGLVLANTYYFTLYAYDDDGNNSNPGISASVYLVEISTPPPPPGWDTIPGPVLRLEGELKVPNANQKKFYLYWSEVTLNTDLSSVNGDIKEYRIYKGTDISVCNTVVATVTASASAYSWSEDYTTANYKPYFFRVTAVDNYGNESNKTVFFVDNLIDANIYAVSSDANAGVVIPDAVAEKLWNKTATPNDYGEDLVIEVSGRLADTDGVTNIYEIKAVKPSTGESVPGFKFDSGILILIGYTGDGTGYAIHSYDGMNWRRLGGTDNKEGEFIWLMCPFLGKFGLKKPETVAEKFQVYNVSPRIFAPDYEDPNDPAGTRNKVKISLDNPTMEGNIKVKIIDMTGSVVQDDSSDNGVKIENNGATSIVTWDGKTKGGNKARSGVYMYQIEAGGKVLTGTFVLAR